MAFKRRTIASPVLRHERPGPDDDHPLSGRSRHRPAGGALRRRGRFGAVAGGATGGPGHGVPRHRGDPLGRGHVRPALRGLRGRRRARPAGRVRPRRGPVPDQLADGSTHPPGRRAAARHHPGLHRRHPRRGGGGHLRRVRQPLLLLGAGLRRGGGVRLGCPGWLPQPGPGRRRPGRAAALLRRGPVGPRQAGVRDEPVAAPGGRARRVVALLDDRRRAQAAVPPRAARPPHGGERPPPPPEPGGADPAGVARHARGDEQDALGDPTGVRRRRHRRRRLRRPQRRVDTADRGGLRAAALLHPGRAPDRPAPGHRGPGTGAHPRLRRPAAPVRAVQPRRRCST